MAAPAHAVDRAAARQDVDDLFGTVAGRRRATRLGGGRGLAFYAQYYLGLATPTCHRRWYQAFDASERLLFLAPRSHGKSITTGRVLVEHRIVTNRNVRILLIGKTKDAARKTVQLVRQDLEHNPRIKADWTAPEVGGPFRAKGFAWKDTFFYVPRSEGLRDPTLEAVGVGGSITGGRFDLILVDDPVDDASMRTARQRRKVLDWFKATIQELLDTDGQIVVIGTRKHAQDLYDSLDKDPTYRVVRDRAILEWPDMTQVQWIERDDPVTGRLELVDVVVPPGQGKVLWPEKWSIKRLLKKFRSLGTVLFNRENQNEVVDDGNSPFKKDWLDKAKAAGAERGLLPWGVDPADPARVHPLCEGLVVWQCADLSLIDDPEKAEEQDSDWTVVLTWGLEWRTGRRYLLRVARRQGLSQGEMMALLRTEAALFPQSLALVVETNSFGKLIEMGLKRTTDLPIHGHHTDKKKHDLFSGVPAMSALYENGKVVLPYGRGAALPADTDDPRALVDVLVAEHHGLGREAHDDTVMAAWVGDVWIRRWADWELKRRKAGGRVTTVG